VPEYKLPDVGEGLTEAEIVTWKVKVGDVIAVNDIVVEIETAKSLVELPSPYAGTVTALLVPEGETVAVGTPIIAIGDAAAAPAAEAAPPAPEPREVPETAPEAGAEPEEHKTLVGYGPRQTEAKRRPRKGAAEPVTEASFVVPGSTPGLVWLAGEGAEWVAPLDVQSGTVGERFDVGDLFWWPLAGVADGLFVSPVDEASYGRAAYWSPTEGLRPINLPDPLQSGIHAAAGNLAVVVSSGVIDIFDLAVGNYVTSFPIQLGEGIVSEVCLSPGQETVAIVGSTGQVDVVETRTGAVLLRLSGVHAFNAMGWTSPEQLVYIADLDERTRRIYAVDVATGAIHNIADLEGAIGWWLTASGAMC